MVISDETRSKIEAVIEKYPKKRGALLPALHLVQEDDGIRPVQVMEVITFYNMFFDSPQAKHHVYVCTNLPCSLRGARSLLSQLESYLGVTSPGETPDGRIFLGHEECLGACGYAPMMRVDDQYHEDLDVEKAKRILDLLGD